MANVIERFLARQQEQNCNLMEVETDDTDRYDLENLWSETDSPVSYVFADYSTHEGTYEQSWSGVECKYIDAHKLYICVDEMDGYYLADKDTVDEWDLRESKEEETEEEEGE